MIQYRKLIERYLGRKLHRKEVVHHKDKDRNNNAISNLEVMSLSEHSRLHNIGRKTLEITKSKLQEQSRKARPGAKLFIEDIPSIRKMLGDGIKQHLIAFAFGVDRITINDISCNKSWSWV